MEKEKKPVDPVAQAEVDRLHQEVEVAKANLVKAKEALAAAKAKLKG